MFSLASINEKAQRIALGFKPFAESEGFEPPNPLRSTVFKTAAINHSANSPSRLGLQIYTKSGDIQKLI